MPEWKELLNAAGHQASVSADGFRRSRPKDRMQESPHRLPAVFVTPRDSSTKSAATESEAGGRLLSESCYPIILHKADAAHIVCWKYKAETTPEMRADHRAKLMALPKIIRNSVSFNVGEDILHLERSFLTGLVAVFTDRAALDFYSDHPEHQKVAALGRGISEKVVSVDFLSE